jgi:YHS domain-containing protein
MIHQWLLPVVPVLLIGQATKEVVSPSTLLVVAPQVQARQESPVICPVMGKAIQSPDQAWKTRDVKGVRYYLCCQPCEEKFDKEPAKFTVAPSDKTKAGGVFLFDPVTTKRLDANKAVASSVYEGILFPFASRENKKAFDKSPKKYSTIPAKELLYCPVSDESVKDYASASDYSDYEGERIYMCCPGCKEPFDKNPAKYKARLEAFRAKMTKSETGVKPVGNEGG